MNFNFTEIRQIVKREVSPLHPRHLGRDGEEALLAGAILENISAQSVKTGEAFSLQIYEQRVGEIVLSDIRGCLQAKCADILFGQPADTNPNAKPDALVPGQILAINREAAALYDAIERFAALVRLRVMSGLVSRIDIEAEEQAV